MRVCSQPGCPKLVPQTGRCTEHAREALARRGNTTARGYGAKHQALRSSLKADVESGRVVCARCHWPILIGEPWHLDHDDDDRSKYIGPSHVACNLSAAGRAAHRQSDPRMPF